jgi:ASCH domain
MNRPLAAATDAELLDRVAAMDAALSPAPTIDTAQWRALTVKLPWAACIASGHKTVENRAARTNYRGPVAIHTSLRGFDETALLSPWVLEALMVAPGQSFHHGRIVAVAEITDCHQCDRGCSIWAQDGAWHWVLSGIRPLQWPVAATGQLGLWKPRPAVLAAVLRQLGSAS